MMESSLMRVNDAAQLLRVSKWTIYRWIEEGRLGATKIGHGSLRVFRESVTALVEANRKEQPSVTRSTPRKVVPVRAAGPNRRS
ncbi:MAG: helix-turn-helix domain-containing protein [Nitrospirota bacterium]|nr:helix-turn-helix domain-containing protein [Nitrospirota bacterium]